jgi:transposase InsO family protein
MVGWAMDKHMEADLVTRAFDMACNQRKPNKGLIVHSDRGVQYTSVAFRRKLIATGARQSMGRKGSCYDNACCESFFHTLKTEEIYFNRYRTRAEAKARSSNTLKAGTISNVVIRLRATKHPVNLNC